MNNFYTNNGKSRNGIVLPILFALISFFATTAQAQCPSGSVAPTNWATYNNGDVVCISSSFNGGLTLNSGAKLFISSTGSFTGQLTAKQGSIVEVAAGGSFSPSGLWDFKGSLINYGTTVLNNASFKTGASIQNEGTISGNSLQYMDGPLTFSNAVCGTMNMPSLQVKNNVVFNNNGRLNISGSFEVQNGGTFNNRGRLYVSGSSVITGKVFNESWMVLQNTSLNPGDSIINLHYLVFNSGITVDKPIRNEGLVMVNGLVNFNAAGTLRQTNPSALFRISGDMTRDNVSNTGGNLYVGGTTIHNNNQLNGLNASNKLKVNKSMNNLGSNVMVDAAMPLYDTTNFTDSYGAPLNCQATGAPTPVKLSSFEAAEKNGKVYLKWTTEMELNHDYFEVEFSTDGRNFTAIDKIAGKGNASTQQQYSAIHTQPAAGFNFYRLKIVATDGSVEYSNVVKLNMGSTLSVEQVKTYPNPFIDRINLDVKLERAQQVQVLLVDNAGKVMQSKSMQLSAGRHTVEVPNLAAYAKGIYTVILQTQEQKVAMKLMK
ncbi:MAG: T9SS type A sorting domain-containing protein [Chitinophagaceae bacterium]